ncbi:MAG: hypothetical protein U1F43_30825 [Myxococcota bacterium]
MSQVEADAVVSLAYTPGTEGQQKGVMLTHGNLASVAMAAAKALREIMDGPPPDGCASPWVRPRATRPGREARQACQEGRRGPAPDLAAGADARAHRALDRPPRRRADRHPALGRDALRGRRALQADPPHRRAVVLPPRPQRGAARGEGRRRRGRPLRALGGRPGARPRGPPSSSASATRPASASRQKLQKARRRVRFVVAAGAPPPDGLAGFFARATASRSARATAWSALARSH